jgi:hypothetical protein
LINGLELAGSYLLPVIVCKAIWDMLAIVLSAKRAILNHQIGTLFQWLDLLFDSSQSISPICQYSDEWSKSQTLQNIRTNTALCRENCKYHVIAFYSTIGKKKIARLSMKFNAKIGHSSLAISTRRVAASLIS